MVVKGYVLKVLQGLSSKKFVLTVKTETSQTINCIFIGISPPRRNLSVKYNFECYMKKGKLFIHTIKRV